MAEFGLLGKTLSHSFSPFIHSCFGDDEYSLFEVGSSEELAAFFEKRDFDGINVTVPYKKEVVKYIDEMSSRAESIGCVNTVVNRNGELYGDNTDICGFDAALSRSGVDLHGKKVLVLGSGGAAMCARHVLLSRGAYVTVISRSGKDNYENIKKHSDADAIVNATPVGMFPNNDACIVDLSVFKNCSFVFDMIYNPAKTKLLFDADNLGMKTQNGLYMLACQAYYSNCLFKSVDPDDLSLIDKAYEKCRKKYRNVVFIGMPGCGKTTLGRLYAERRGRDFVDSDEEIERRFGKSPKEIICENGEEYFRKLESQVLSDICKRTGSVIAAGGGVVTKDENRFFLSENSRVVYLSRELSKLATNGRPLSFDLDSLFEKRREKYESFCDLKITLGDDINGNLDTISEVLDGEDTCDPRT